MAEIFTTEYKDRQGLICGLLEVAENDNDHNGDNGDEYLWDESKELGFETNVAYLEDLLSQNNDMSDDELAKLLIHHLNCSVYSLEYKITESEYNKDVKIITVVLMYENY